MIIDKPSIILWENLRLFKIFNQKPSILGVKPNLNIYRFDANLSQSNWIHFSYIQTINVPFDSCFGLCIDWSLLF